jgi:integrase
MNTSAENGTASQLRAENELHWTMTRVVRDGQEQRSEALDFDLTELTGGYSLSLLVAIKTALINSRNRLSIRTIWNEHLRLKSILLNCQSAGKMTYAVEQIDLPFLHALESIKQDQSKSNLDGFRRFLVANRGNASILAPDLRPEDFPRLVSVRGERGEALNRILSQALSRAAVAQTLTTVENAYEAGQIDIGSYAFSMLAFQVFFRPASYRQLRLRDLNRDENSVTGQVTWFLDMLPIKTRVDNPNRLSIKVSPDLGEILQLQREHVVRRYGHLVADADLNKLALFPARRLRIDGTCFSNYSNMNHGMCQNSTTFKNSYLLPIEKLVRRGLSFNALRHTVGTQLALAGLSASRIAAVLRHATDSTCQRYVDLFFQGVLDRISDAMQPAFDEHFPVYKEVMERVISKHDPIQPQNAIISEDLVTGRREVTAACGRRSLCGYAPLACYDCNKFRPCWDADHKINLDLVNREIADFEGQGLAMQHESQKYKHLRNSIRVVISICQLKSQTAEQGASA